MHRAVAVATVPPEPADVDPLSEAQWQAAYAALQEARTELAQLGPTADPWPELMARHAVHLAMRRLRAAQLALGGEDAWWVV
jgi:DNA primase